MKAFATMMLALAATAVLPPEAAWAGTPPEVEQALQAAIDGPQRTPAFRLRDVYRHPLQTLEFFGARSDMTIIEVLPGGGWYTEILAPFLHDRGMLIEATPAASSANPFARRSAASYAQKLAAAPAIYGKIAMTPFEPPAYMPLGAPDSADMVVTFLNLHDLVFFNVHKQVTSEIVERFFRSAAQVLKPGGVLGIVAHRARAGSSVSESIALGRVPQDYAIREAEKAGLKLVATSEINANPRDDGSYPVWYLPPSLQLGEQDRAKYTAIGESDDMTLLFARPQS